MNVGSTDIAQVLMTWEPDDTEGAVTRVKRSIESFAAACRRSGLHGSVVLVDGAFDAALWGGDLRDESPTEVIIAASSAADKNGMSFASRSAPLEGCWPSESYKLTAALRIASLRAPALIRLDSDEVIDESSDLGGAVDAMRSHHGAMVEWDTIGKQAHGSQNVGKKKHLRMFTSHSTLTAGPAYHGSYKVYDGEWLALRRRGEENLKLGDARVFDASKLVRIVNHPAERSAAMHEAKARLFAHRYKHALSDR